MTQYIDEDALVVEIDRQKIGYNTDGKHSVEYNTTRKILDIIDTIEVKEVNLEDLEEELDDWLGERVGKWTGKECESTERRNDMTQEQAQAIYNDGYKHGQDDMDALLRIGKVYANNEHVRHFEAVKKLVEENPNHSDEYKRGKLEAIDLYMGMELFNHDVDKLALRKTAEEQARIVRNRLEQRYREAVEQRRIDSNTYLQITACIEAVYQELFFAGFNVGLGELIGPQKITLNKED